MAKSSAARDYSLVGKDGRLAVDSGLAGAEWYACPIPRKRLKELMRREDGPAMRDTALWFGYLAAFGLGGYLFWGTWWCVPFFACYGVLYGSASDSRWHEHGHGTAFKTRWMNDAVYQIACFMVLREPTPWRWSHTRHHTDTIIVGRDPEIAVSRPPDVLGILLNIFALKSGLIAVRQVLLHSIGRLTPAEQDYIPEMEHFRVFRTARIWVAIWAAVIAACLIGGTILPAMFIGLPSFYGAWMLLMFGLTQHAGLAEDVLDHRLNSRTVLMNPVFRFIYLNMNYHVEHHMFPMVPYYRLPELHEEMKPFCPTPYKSTWEAYREIIPAIIRQMRDPSYHVVRTLPEGARAIDDAPGGAAIAA
jgi:fatty acid desaturase